MAIEFDPHNPLERAIRERDRVQTVRFVAEGREIISGASVGWLAHPAFPESVVQLVLQLALPRKHLEIIDTDRWYHCNGAGLRETVRRALAPLPDKANAAEKHLIDAILRADSAAVVDLAGKSPGTFRNFRPELLVMLPELTREATVAFFTNGFVPAVIPRLFEFLLREADTPDVLADLPYRKRLMYANLLIHILQGETVRTDEDWYPMGNSIEQGCDRRVYCRSYSYYYDPRHIYEPRFADGEYEKPKHSLRRKG